MLPSEESNSIIKSEVQEEEEEEEETVGMVASKHNSPLLHVVNVNKRKAPSNEGGLGAYSYDYSKRPYNEQQQQQLLIDSNELKNITLPMSSFQGHDLSASNVPLNLVSSVLVLLVWWSCECGDGGLIFSGFGNSGRWRFSDIVFILCYNFRFGASKMN